MLLAFSAIVAIQLGYYLFFFRRLADAIPQSPTPMEELPPVSVVICAHDELNSLRKNLPAILGQKYPRFEVIVVNDNSRDDSEMMLKRLQAQHAHLVLRDIRGNSDVMRGKKFPLTIGIRAAAYDHLLLTDADCSPSSDHWIRDMAGQFMGKNSIVLGYAPFRRHPGFLNRFIRFECLVSAMQYLSMALSGIPYMGVGRNLAYQKHLFFEHNIYIRFPHLLSGDDDLLINAAASRSNTAIQISKSSYMYSEPKPTWEEYWHQKRRHVSTAKYYKKIHQVLLGGFAFTHCFTYFCFFALLLYSPFIVEGIMLFLIRLVAVTITLNAVMKRLAEDDLRRWIPVFDFLQLIYYLKLLPAAFQTKKDSWK